MNKQTICQNCKNWKLTDSFLKFGWCSFFNKKTEWCAGIKLQTKKKLIICEGFNEKENL